MSRVPAEGGWPRAARGRGPGTQPTAPAPGRLAPGGRGRTRSCRPGSWWVLLFLLLLSAFFLLPTVTAAEEIIFLQDGRTIRAEKTEIIGDRVRIEKPSETIELPRGSVLSIHRLSPPTASPAVPPPAEVYRDLSQQMTDKVRREIQERPGNSQTRSP